MTEDQSDGSPFAAWEFAPERSLDSPPRAARSIPSDELCPTEALALDLDESTTWERPSSCSGRDSGRPTSLATLKAGEEIGGFRLIAELGRGAFARVFLACETSLGSRFVALKVSAPEGDEPQVLARLQHSNIVPVHSARDDPVTGLRLLCMPYLGGANLAQVLEETWAARGPTTSGRSLVDALDVLSRRLPSTVIEAMPTPRGPTIAREGKALRVDPPSAPPRPPRSSRIRGGCPTIESDQKSAVSHSCQSTSDDDSTEDRRPCRRFLLDADPIQAAAWIVAQLAEGLEHAHSHGLLHRDLKPSNVLIAGDGTPMLLDFNLSVESDLEDDDDHGDVRRAMLGGTLPYMAPEHLDALDPEGATSAEAVDRRSDLYSLGLILFEILAGEPAFPASTTVGGALDALRRLLAARRAGAPSVRSLRPEVPPSLDALVARCLDPDPDLRYQNAGDLAEDLRRFLDDLPMKHGPEPSLVERTRKWARRHPTACSSSSILTGSIVLFALLLFGSWRMFEAMEELYTRLKLQTFRRDAQECRFLLHTLGDPERLGRGLNLADATLKSSGVDEPRGVLAGSWRHRLDEDERDEVRRSTVELIVESTHARVLLASRTPEPIRRAALRTAVARLNELEQAVDDPPAILFRRRSRYRAALGDVKGAEEDRRAAEAHPPVTCQDLTALGTAQLVDGDLAAAEQSLLAATVADVTSFWAWFALGHCHFEQRRFGRAAADFTACVVARPDFAWGHFNRGLALANAGCPQEALDAYSQALKLDPTFREARIDRGLVELAMGRPERAEVDLRVAMRRPHHDPRLAAALAEALARQGKTAEAKRIFDDLIDRKPTADLLAARGLAGLDADPIAAARDFEAALAREPEHAMSHYGLARLIRRHDRKSALEHLDRAVAAAPELFEAVELRALERARQGDRAALDDVERLVAEPTPNRLFNAACALAILGESPRAVELLGRAILGGYPADGAAVDPDLVSLRGRDDFNAALARGRVDDR